MNDPIEILIADDHDLVREGLAARIGISSNMNICAEVSNGRDALEQALVLRPDIILLDISMPNMGGLEAAKEILAVEPESKIIFLSVYDNTEYVHEALRIGAKGYLLKDISREEMMTAIHAVHSGGVYLSSKIAVQVGTQERKPEKAACRYNLSDREREVLVEIASGATNKEIASRLEISVRTVESHRMAIREKTGGGNAAALSNIAADLGLV